MIRCSVCKEALRVKTVWVPDHPDGSFGRFKTVADPASVREHQERHNRE